MIYSTERLQDELKQIIRKNTEGEHPHLVIFRTSDDAASEVYIRQKKNRGEELGFKISIIDLMKVHPSEWVKIVETYCESDDVHGVIVQKPFFKDSPQMRLVDKFIRQAIPVVKDVDCMTIRNRIRSESNSIFAHKACTAKGIEQIIVSKFGNDLSGKSVVIINRSELIGKPLFQMLLKRNATITMCHSKTPQDALERQIRSADIIVTATGIKDFLRAEMFDSLSPYFIVDAGICRINGKVYGDCDRALYDSDNVELTPVPGGVGRLTVLNLLLNTAAAYSAQMLFNAQPLAD